MSWTNRLLPDETSSPMYASVIKTFMSVDWSSTAVGPLDTWDYSTRSFVTLILQSQQTAMLFIMGPERIIVYNSMAAELYQDKHPSLMGMRYADGFRDLDIVDQIILQTDAIKSSGQPTSHKIAPVQLKRSLDSSMEELHISWEFVPFMDDRQEYSSVLCRFKDHTHEVREKRRSEFLATLHDSLARITTYNEHYKACQGVFSQNEDLFEFMMLYVASEHGEYRQFALFDHNQHDKAQQHREQQILPLVYDADARASPSWSRTLREDLVFTPVGTYVFPIIQETNSTLMSHVLVLGSNPLHAIDDYQEIFLKSCATTIASALGLVESSILLKQSDTRFQEVLLRTDIGFNVEDETTRGPLFVNDAWRHMCGFYLPLGSPDTTSAFAKLIDPIHRDSFIEDYINLTKDNPMHNRDVKLLRAYQPPGEVMQRSEDTIWLRVSSSYLPPSYKQASNFLFTVIDISYYKYLERVTQEKFDRAIELQKLKSESSFERERANVAERNAAKHLQYIDFSSHELRNPLGAIMQAADLSALLLQSLPTNAVKSEEISEHLSSIMICAKHMGRIVDDTLSFSQLDHGALQIALMPCRLDTTVLTVLAMFKAELKVKKITLNCQVADIGTINSDASRFSQILINVLTNSLKFCPQDGTGRISVSLTATAFRNKLRVDCAVGDNGPGMENAVLDSLFQKFSQASAKTHVQYGGSGLGLYISKRLTELLGGQIRATSIVGHGTEVQFFVMADSVAETLPVLHISKTHRPILPLKRNSEAQKGTLLVVEDNLVNQRLMTKLLGDRYHVHTANNGLECLRLMQSAVGHTIDLVLCDIEMPIMNGYEAVRQVKEWQRSQGHTPIPFLAVSANSRPEQVQHMLDAGMDSTIRKPFGRNDILNKVDAMLNA